MTCQLTAPACPSTESGLGFAVRRTAALPDSLDIRIGAEGNPRWELRLDLPSGLRARRSMSDDWRFAGRDRVPTTNREGMIGWASGHEQPHI